MRRSTVARHRPAHTLSAFVMVVTLTACGTSHNSVTVQDSTRITKGQELIDLQRAHAVGAVDDRDYESLRQIIMRRPR